MPAVAVISCRFEWQAVTALFPDAEMCPSPFGQWFTAGGTVFFQGGWGKISAAASAQYAIGRWRPSLLINIGTCGGFPGEIAPGEIVLAERVVVYDIVEQMTGADAAIAHYTTGMDLCGCAGPCRSRCGAPRWFRRTATSWLPNCRG